jgi:hypothetical protein
LDVGIEALHNIAKRRPSKACGLTVKREKLLKKDTRKERDVNEELAFTTPIEYS